MFPIIIVRILGAVTLLVGLGMLALVVYNPIFRPEVSNDGWIRGAFWSLLFIFFGWCWLRHQGKGIEDVKPLDLNAPETVQATQQARESLPEFIAAVEQGLASTFIRCRSGESSKSEFDWAYVHAHQQGRFTATPVDLSLDDDESVLPDDDRRAVAEEQVLDWLIREPDGWIRGGFTLLAELAVRERLGKTLTPEMKRQRKRLPNAGPV